MPLLTRAAELENAAKRISARNAAEADASALGDALDTFSKCLDELRPALAQARALRAHGVDLAMPTNTFQVVEALRGLATRIDANPTAVRERRQEADGIKQLTAAVSSEVETTLRARLQEARGGAGAGTARSLRMIALNDAADALERALANLDEFGKQLPRTVEDLQAVDAAEESIRATIAAPMDPKHSRLRAFLQRTLDEPPPTLEDVDAELLLELQSSGAAVNFVVRPRER
jgi:hypothetical protein